MESIKNNLSDGGLLMNQLQSGLAVKKSIGASPEGGTAEIGSLGNVLQSFSSILKDQMGNIDNLQDDASQAQQTYAVGGDIELHNVILATEKADLALQLAMQVRNKVIAAYQEISRMTV